jgi:hypothetical protein
MMNIMIKVFRWAEATAIVSISSLMIFKIALADGQTQTIKLSDPLGGSESFTSVSTAVAGFLFWDIAAPLSTIMVLVGAFQLMTSAGDPEKVSQGKKTVMYAAIGLVIALIAGGIVSIIKSFITGA